MDRARRAGTTALVIALVLISVGLPAGTRPAIAAVSAGPSRRSWSRRCRPAGPAPRTSSSRSRTRARACGPGRPGARVRDLVRLDGDAQGVLERVLRPRGRATRAGRQRRGRRMPPSATWRTAAGSPRRAARSRCGSSAARSSMPSAGAMPRTRSSKAGRPPRQLRVEPRAIAWRRARKRRGHERQRARLLRERLAEPAGIRGAAGAGARTHARHRAPIPTPSPTPSPTPMPSPTVTPATDPTPRRRRPPRRRPRARPRRRLRRRRRARCRPPHPHADADADAQPDPDARPRARRRAARDRRRASAARRYRGHDLGHPHDGARGPRKRPHGVHRGLDRRHRAVPRRGRCGGASGGNDAGRDRHAR